MLRVAALSGVRRVLPRRGLEEFYELHTAWRETPVRGRAWAMNELRRKSWEDLHKLWYVLYKERNMLLTSRARAARTNQPWPLVGGEEDYFKVKRSMARIKHVLAERETIRLTIAAEEAAAATAADGSAPAEEEGEAEEEEDEFAGMEDWEVYVAKLQKRAKVARRVSWKRKYRRAIALKRQQEKQQEQQQQSTL